MVVMPGSFSKNKLPNRHLRPVLKTLEMAYGTGTKYSFLFEVEQKAVIMTWFINNHKMFLSSVSKKC